MANSFPRPERIYQYRPLAGARYIRLLRLRSYSRRSSLRNYELIEVLLDKAPPYSALSYRWDSEGGFGYILVEQKLVKVTLNCKLALKTLSGWCEELIWIDQVCIDQCSIPERNSQVAMMADVYKQAKETIVWLGGNLSDRNFSLNLHVGVRSGAFGVNNMITQQYSDPRHPLGGNTKTAEDLEQYDHDLYRIGNVLEEVLQRGWFGRVWMIQEVSLAKQIAVYCTNASMSWDDLVQATRSLSAAQGSSRRALFHVPLDLMDVRDHYQSGSVTFSELIKLARDYEASDPRDKIYGLLGLSQEFAKMIGQPDYNKSIQEVWTNASSALLSKLSIKALLDLTSAIDLSSLPEELPPHPEDDYIPQYLTEMDRFNVRQRQHNGHCFKVCHPGRRISKTRFWNGNSALGCPVQLMEKFTRPWMRIG